MQSAECTKQNNGNGEGEVVVVVVVVVRMAERVQDRVQLDRWRSTEGQDSERALGQRERASG